MQLSILYVLSYFVGIANASKEQKKIFIILDLLLECGIKYCYGLKYCTD